LLFDIVQYIEHEWEENKNLEDLIENEPEITRVTGSKLPGSK